MENKRNNQNPLISLGFVLLLITIDASDENLSHYPTHNEEVSSELALKSGESCSLPPSWAGSWFRSGVHLDITINLTAISTMGQCVEADGDKFVLYNREFKCFRCVAFHEKHVNVLQYKESYCQKTRLSLQSLCSGIQGDFNLFSMFRLDAVPIDCPFRGRFTFTYDRGHGNCRDPISIIDTCIQPSRVLLNYQACPDVSGTESHAEELQCLAVWKEGSTRFLLGLMQYRHPSSYEERFRCFAYEKAGKYGGMGPGQGLHRNNATSENVIYHLAQSGDASCVGISPTEGSRTLTLRKAPTPQSCQFPDWLQKHAQWETLDQTLRYAFDNSSTLRISNFSHTAGSMLTRRAICMQILDNPSPQTKVTFVAHSTSECEMGFVCMTIFRRNGHILEVQTGNLSRKMENACHLAYFDPDASPLRTLTSPTPETQQCPQFGLFDVTGGFSHNEQDLSESEPCTNPADSTFVSGCTSFDTFHLQKRCSKPDTYLCHGWWEEPNGEEYLIATSIRGWNTHESQRFCFAFREILPNPSISSELKAKKAALNFEEYEDSLLDNQQRRNIKKTFQFSRFSDTCRRHITPGKHWEFTFNVTLRDSCAQASTGNSSSNIFKFNIIWGIISTTISIFFNRILNFVN